MWRGVKTYDQLRAANLRHLITNTDRYGKVAGIWFDGGGKWDMNDPVNKDFFKPLFKAQPWLIMSPRCGHPDHRPDWRCSEQRLGRFRLNPQWEMCIPIESSVWFWAGGKAANTKDVDRCVKLLIMCAVRDGNLLLNISPMPNGKIQPLQAAVLRGIGRWLGRFGRTIYATRGGPYMPGTWGGATRKGKKVHLHILQELPGGELDLPPLPAAVLSARMLTGGAVKAVAEKRRLRLELDEEARRAPIDRIVELEIDRDSMDIEPIKTQRTRSLARDAAASASSFFSYRRPSGKTVHDSPSKVIGNEDGKGGYWTAKADDPKPWIALDLRKPRAFREIYLVEKHTRIRKFEIQARDEKTGKWKTLYRGRRMNYTSVRLPEPVTARKVRVLILETEGGPPQISFFDILG